MNPTSMVIQSLGPGAYGKWYATILYYYDGRTAANSVGFTYTRSESTKAELLDWVDKQEKQIFLGGTYT